MGVGWTGAGGSLCSFRTPDSGQDWAATTNCQVLPVALSTRLAQWHPLPGHPHQPGPFRVSAPLEPPGTPHCPPGFAPEPLSKTQAPQSSKVLVAKILAFLESTRKQVKELGQASKPGV